MQGMFLFPCILSGSLEHDQIGSVVLYSQDTRDGQARTSTWPVLFQILGSLHQPWRPEARLLTFLEERIKA